MSSREEVSVGLRSCDMRARLNSTRYCLSQLQRDITSVPYGLCRPHHYTQHCASSLMRDYSGSSLVMAFSGIVIFIVRQRVSGSCAVPDFEAATLWNEECAMGITWLHSLQRPRRLPRPGWEQQCPAHLHWGATLLKGHLLGQLSSAGKRLLPP